jgi:hypothetical protein
MEEITLSHASRPQSIAEIDFPTGVGPQPHPPRFLDPREVEKHFVPILKNRPSPEQRWATKANATPFPGV